MILSPLHNNTRQLYLRDDVGENKALSLGGHLSEEGLFPCAITAYPYRFEEMLEKGYDFEDYDTILFLPDNNPTRVKGSIYGLEHAIPIIHGATSRDGNDGRCIIQEPGGACFGCIVPNEIDDDSYPCHLPGIIDVTQVVAGLVVYAVDTVLSDRPRAWNYKKIFLTGGAPDECELVERDPGCALCGQRRKDEE